MKRTSIKTASFLLALSALTGFGATGQPVRSVQSEHDTSAKQTHAAPKPGATNVKDIDVNLGPGGHLEFPISLLRSNTIVSARFEPVAGTKATILTFSVRVNGQTLAAPRRGEGHRQFTVKVATSGPQPTGLLENLSTQPVKGTLLIASMDGNQRTIARAVARTSAVKSAADRVSKPDLTLAFNHILQRHIRDYPGGKSDLEQRVSQAIAQQGVKKEMLERLAKTMREMQPRLEARAKNSLFVNRSISLPVTSSQIRSLLRDDVQPQPLPLVPAKYLIRLYGIRSHRCADDVGWEIGCDTEEPYVVWSAIGPNYVRVGVTEDGETRGEGSEYLFTKDILIVSASPSNSQPVKTAFPLVFAYQVIEDDPDGPTRAQLIEAMKTGVALAGAIYMENISGIATEGGELLKQVIDIATLAFGGGDDRYPSLAAVFNERALFEDTSGNRSGPLDRSLFDSPGNYDHFSIHVAPVTIGSTRHWSLAYTITRVDEHSKPASR